jgi:hypothetical protein
MYTPPRLLEPWSSPLRATWSRRRVPSRREVWRAGSVGRRGRGELWRRFYRAGVPATALMRQWVLDRLEAGEDDEIVPVADLKRLIAERAGRAA